jgi:hypothetical protein
VARIRSVKPEFHSDERLARDLTREQRLFYIGMWNEADDEGRLRANSRKLLGAIFPYEDDLDGSFVDAVLVRLAETGRAVLYAIGGERICQLTKFPKHQKVNKPTPSKLPPPPKKVASVLGWLSGSAPVGLPADSRGEVEVEVEVEQGKGSVRGSGVAREDSPSAEQVNTERPNPWAPNDDHRARATELGLDIDSEVRKYRAHRGREARTMDHDDFTLWLERAPDFKRSGRDEDDQVPRTYTPPLAPQDDTPAPSPEQRAQGMALVREAVEQTNGKHTRSRTPMPPETIDDPDVIARREEALARAREQIGRAAS